MHSGLSYNFWHENVTRQDLCSVTRSDFFLSLLFIIFIIYWFFIFYFLNVFKDIES
jgi:hypothetical protein